LSLIFPAFTVKLGIFVLVLVILLVGAFPFYHEYIAPPTQPEPKAYFRPDRSLAYYYNISKSIDAILREEGFNLQWGFLPTMLNATPPEHQAVFNANASNWQNKALLFALILKNFGNPTVYKLFIWSENDISFIWVACEENYCFALTLSGEIEP